MLVFLWRLGAGGGEDMAFERHWGVVPQIALGHGEALHRFAPFITYMFLHGGFAHIAGNMLFLWIFGDDIEDALGHARYLAFYLACGVVGALVYCMFCAAPDAPLVGASGAIAGVLGAYLMSRPCANVRVLVFIRVVSVRAMRVLLAWIALQVWHVMAPSTSDTAWWAHIGGFATGCALLPLLRAPHVRLFECVESRGPVNPWGKPRAP